MSLPEAPTTAGAQPDGRAAEPRPTAGEVLRGRRELAGMTRGDLAGVSGVPEETVAAMEDRLARVTVAEWDQYRAALRATAPPRPDWWEAGAAHDATLPRPDPAVLNDDERAYWDAIDAWKAELRRGGWWHRRDAEAEGAL